MSKVLGLVDIKVKELESFDPWGPTRSFTSYLGLYLYFLRVLNISPQRTSDRYSPRIMVGVDVYWCMAYVSAFYDRSMYTSATTVPHCHLTWLACICFQHYSLLGLEFDFDLDRARKLLFSQAMHFGFKVIFDLRKTLASNFILKRFWFSKIDTVDCQAFLLSPLIEHRQYR